jgi:hypothetical protein
MTVLRFDSLGGDPIGLLVSYGIKPCAIDMSGAKGKERYISSDLPGYACTVIEDRFKVPCVFCMSAAGDQVPVEQSDYCEVSSSGIINSIDLGVEKGFEIVERLGSQMAKDIAFIAEEIKCTESSPYIDCNYTSVKCQTKEMTEKKLRTSCEYKVAGEAEVTADIIAIGDIALVAYKPEVNAITEHELQTGSPYSHTLMVSMVNGGMKYMPDKKSYDRITWESQNSLLMPGSAEMWVENVLNVLMEKKMGKYAALAYETVEGGQ